MREEEGVWGREKTVQRAEARRAFGQSCSGTVGALSLGSGEPSWVFEEGVGALLAWQLGPHCGRQDIGQWWSPWDSGLGLCGRGTERAPVRGGGLGRARWAWC